MIRALQKIAKVPPVWLFALAALGVCGIAWAVVKLMVAGGGATVFALLRDAGHQVGGGGLLGALGGAAAGAWRWISGAPPPGSDYSYGGYKPPPLQPGQHRIFTDDGFVYTYTPDPTRPGHYKVAGVGPPSSLRGVLFELPDHSTFFGGNWAPEIPPPAGAP